MAFRDGFLPKLGYEHPDLNDKPRVDPFAAADLELMKRIAHTVDVHYCGQPFHIRVSHQDGIVRLQLPILMGASNWYVVKIADLKSDPGLREVIRGCGELLERYRIPRAGFDRDHYVAALNAMPLTRRRHGYVAQ